MTYTISKDFAFSASHQLDGLPEDHPCSRLHGHNYTVRVELESGLLNDVGFILDYRELGFVKDLLDNEFDHQHLNHAIAVNPTAENLARWVWTQIVRHFDQGDGTALSFTVAVGVSETPKTWAWFR